MSLKAPVVQLASQGDGDLGDSATDVNALAFGGTADAQSGVSLVKSNSGSAETEAAGVGTFATDTLTDGASSFLVSRADDDLVDGATDVNTLASSGAAAAQNNVSLIGGDPLLGSAASGTPDIWTSNADDLGHSNKLGTASVPALATFEPNAQPSSTVNVGQPATIANGATVEIDGASAQSVIFEGTTGTLKLDDAPAFTGEVSGLTGADALDLVDVSYGPNTTATFLGNTSGGTLTVTDGTHTANIALVGNYLSSNWDLSSDGNGGTVVVDPASSNNWQPLAVGGGGWVTGIDIAPDGTMVVRTDTYGAYIWNGTQWQQLVTSTSMPATFIQPGNGPGLNTSGVYEIQIAPSNSSIMYMEYMGYVFKSTNKGTTWTQTSFAQVTDGSNDAYRMDGQKMAIDPNNPNVVYVGTPTNGLFVTTNGGVTWQSVSAVPQRRSDGAALPAFCLIPLSAAPPGEIPTPFLLQAMATASTKAPTLAPHGHT